ncbi:LicD family protein [Litorilituus lipolyticus]|uniref:LicD/FKTN/FKRP nucleotidyltransferase domain-containing protein n=1 Tax=Litorilituus lipolyticus TaxID=2491017 RepID=A0A502L9Z7_9GAMM|nr:LicD family protein [Litorilituus lipolyticus]TPH17077.1 hypothetical protein EPA86_05180 [Litorilituus lipolyticus]
MTDKSQRWLDSLEQITAILQQHNLNSFLDTGTLLGAVRDGQFIPWDNDIDISLLDKDYNKQTLLKVAKSIYHAGYNVNYHQDAIYIYKDPDIAIGIMLYRHSNQSYINQFGKIELASRFLYLLKKIKSRQLIYCQGHTFTYSFKASMLKLRALISIIPNWLLDKSVISEQTKQINIPEHFFNKLEEFSFYGVNFNVPAETKEYLEFRYGSNWKTPISDYDYMTDDHSLV